ncbi:MAG: TetR/AcrR family transcriptional regulator [Defluviitaleaceae bacterium]|nr:TetR/AcrR family transcriptional regulator [Defluviitaleaceae bacterium]
MPKRENSEQTKQRIIETATQMFKERDWDWDNVKIEDVVAELGVTRGAFYHHFKSREELVMEVVGRIFTENDPFKQACETSGLNGLEKLKVALKHSIAQSQDIYLQKSVKAAISDPVVFKGEVMHTLLEAHIHGVRLTEEGNRDGSLRVAYPKQATQAVVLLFNLWLNPVISNVPYEEYVQKVEFLRYLTNILGVPMIDDETVELILQLHKSI